VVTSKQLWIDLQASCSIQPVFNKASENVRTNSMEGLGEGTILGVGLWRLQGLDQTPVVLRRAHLPTNAVTRPAQVMTRWSCKIIAQIETKKPTLETDPQCFWKGPAFYPPGGPVASEFKEMYTQSMTNQETHPEMKHTWNEIVLDLHVLVEDLIKEPALAVPAIIWVKHAQGKNHDLRDDIAKKTARQIAQEMKKLYQMPTAVPIIGVDVTAKVEDYGPSEGPFFFDDSSDFSQDFFA
jgi:hypothetical protein